jgi:DeoR/GlpR family transcriptional regulator of sugar metabolism
MLSAKREADIVNLVNQSGTISVGELAAHFGVVEMTIRRDLKKLERLRLLRRTHGGAIRIDNSAGMTLLNVVSSTQTIQETLPDALILAPVQDRAAHTLRERALRSQIPLIAEGAPQEGAIYVGLDNFRAVMELGLWTADYVSQNFNHDIHLLDVGMPHLTNTFDRSRGFIAGLQTGIGREVQAVSVDGHGLYNEAYQAALDGLRVHPETNVIFGINDDSVLGALQAYSDLGRDPKAIIAVNVGGEGKTLFDVLSRGGALKACLAMFPEMAGRMTVDVIARLWAGEDIGTTVNTPTALLTAHNINEYYTHNQQEWILNFRAVEQLEQTRFETPVPQALKKRISFAFHYHTHEWYENVTKAMQERAEAFGIIFSVEDVNEDLKAEINELRRLIGKAAAAYVKDGETIILDTGTATTNMTQFLQGHHNLTVVTNSVTIFHRLQQNPNINLRLTGGDFHRHSQSLVGPAATRYLADIRVDKAFIVAGGLSQSFGISCANLAEAEIRRAMIEAAREVVLLVDHTVFNVEANEHIANINKLDTVITDAGTLAAQRFQLNQNGLRVIVAGHTPHIQAETAMPQPRRIDTLVSDAD